jgi:hypothetical protein
MVEDLHRWIRKLSATAHHGHGDGDMDKALVKTESLVKIWADEHGHGEKFPSLLEDHRAAHPGTADVVQMPRSAVPNGAHTL